MTRKPFIPNKNLAQEVRKVVKTLHWKPDLETLKMVRENLNEEFQKVYNKTGTSYTPEYYLNVLDGILRCQKVLDRLINENKGLHENI